MPQAVERIRKAIVNGENILVYGDNDVDGMTGTALLYEFLHFIGANVFHYISNRTTRAIFWEAIEMQNSPYGKKGGRP